MADLPQMGAGDEIALFRTLKDHSIPVDSIPDGVLPITDVGKIIGEYSATPWDTKHVDRCVKILKRYKVRGVVFPLGNATWLHGDTITKGVILLVIDRYILAYYDGETAIIPIGSVRKARAVGTENDGVFEKKETVHTGTQEKSVVKGAVIGGAIAGPAGAVVGAINNKGKTVDTYATIPDRTLVRKNLVLTFTDGTSVTYKDSIRYDQTGNDLLSDAETINRQLSHLADIADILSIPPDSEIYAGSDGIDTGNLKTILVPIAIFVVILGIFLGMIAYLNSR